MKYTLKDHLQFFKEILRWVKLVIGKWFIPLFFLCLACVEDRNKNDHEATIFLIWAVGSFLHIKICDLEQLIKKKK